jgi:hypothetical protein
VTCATISLYTYVPYLSERLYGRLIFTSKILVSIFLKYLTLFKHEMTFSHMHYMFIGVKKKVFHSKFLNPL